LGIVHGAAMLHNSGLGAILGYAMYDAGGPVSQPR
jgi:hypothetical protein